MISGCCGRVVLLIIGWRRVTLLHHARKIQSIEKDIREVWITSQSLVTTEDIQRCSTDVKKLEEEEWDT
jgi:hypothetical protein